MGREGLRARASGRVSSGRNDRAVGRGRTCVSLWMVGGEVERGDEWGFRWHCVGMLGVIGFLLIRGIFEGEDVGISGLV